MLKKWLSVLVCIMMLLALLPTGGIAVASGTRPEEGSWANPYDVTEASQLVSLLGSAGGEAVYIRLGADIVTEERETMYAANLLRHVAVRGVKYLDLNGHTLKSKLPFNLDTSPFSLFVIEAGADLTVEDSAGGGEVIFDRYIPTMGETNEQTEIFLDRPVNVFDVYGNLTVNGGEITAGHYESEYYTYTDGYIYLDSSPSPGTVNSVTPGNAVIVRSGGCFTSNGGEYYGRGFIADDEGWKEVACTAVSLYGNARATINAGDFYGKSNADVFSVDGTAQITVLSGNFYARYDNRITIDKMNETAYYVNVDCGRVGLPLRAFRNGQETFTHIYVDGSKFNYTSDFTAEDNQWFMDLGSSGTGVSVTVETLEGNGTQNNPFLLKNAADIAELFQLRRKTKTYVRLENDIEDCLGNYSVYGNYELDINGHKLGGKLGFNDWHETYTLFIVMSGSYMTVEDSAGGGEIIFDRFIPNMGETNEQTDIFLYRCLTVFDVYGNLTVNGGEITAGHYESEYYTYIKKYNTGGGTSAGTVHSITPGCAVVVRDGGRFTSNGGEYYGRGFTIDDNGEKDVTCSAVRLHNGAIAIINDGDFYGKSNADVFYVAWGANAFVYAGRFEAQYDNRITVDKMNGVAYYVNVDCGRIGLPLRAFSHARKDREIITVDGQEYTFASDFTTAQSNAFENLGTDGTGATVTATPSTTGSSRIARGDGIDASFVLTYSPTDHFEVVHEDALYFSESFAPIPAAVCVPEYSWKVTKRVGSQWENVTYTNGAIVSNDCLITAGDRLDLYDLARYIDGGMVNGATYRIEAHAAEWWRQGRYIACTVSSNVVEVDCVYERIGNISLSDSVTGIVWPEHGKKPVNRTVEQDAFTATLTFEERSNGGTRYVPMSERSTFARGGSYRLKVQITPKQYYRADPENSVTVGGKAVTDITVSGGVLTGYIVPLDVLPATIASVPVRGSLSDGTELSAASPLNSPIAGVVVSTVWYKDDVVFTGPATQGVYRARVTVTAQDPYAFSAATTVKVFGQTYQITDLSADGLSGSVLTDPQYVACTHAQNTNGYTYDAQYHYLICSACGAELESGAHTFGNWTHQGGQDVRTCSVCGYQESVSNGKSYAPYFRLTGKAPRLGDTLPVLAICEEDQKYGSLENETEWYVDAVNYTNYVPADTIMQAGHVYYAFIKINASNDYYFTQDTAVAMLDPTAAVTQERYGDWNHLEVVLAFTPRAFATAQFTLGDLTGGQTYGEFLAGFDAAIDGVHDAATFAVYRNGSLEAGLVYSYATDSWWIASGDVEEFMSRSMDPDAEYKVALTLADTGRYFAESDVTVANPGAAASFNVVAGELGCTVTAIYRLCPVGFAAGSVTLQNNLKENFFVEKEAVDDGGYTDMHTVFEINGKMVTVSDYREVTDGDKTYYMFSLPDVAPDQMTDTVKATFHASKGGEELVSAPTEYSIATYCYSMLEKTDDPELRTLLVDLLDYGAAAQAYTGRHTDSLANQNLTEEQKAWGTAADPELTSVKNAQYRTVGAPSVTWAGVSLRLGHSITMQFVFTTADTAGLTVRIEDADDHLLQEITAQELKAAGGYYIAEFSGLTAGQMSDVVYATAYKNDTAVSDTVAYSIESYAFAKQNDPDEALAALVKAMMKYGNAAYAYDH